MKNITFIIIILISLSQIQAQTLTLEEAMNKAVQHNYDLKNQALNIALSENDAAKTRTRRQPTVNANGDFRYNPILQTSVIPGDAFGQQNTEDQRIKFGTNFNVLFSIEGNYKILDPVYQTDIDINQAEANVQSATLRKNTAQVKLDAATAYYEILLQQTQVELANNRLRRAQDLLEVSKIRQELGAALPVDVQKSELDVQNAQALLTQAQNVLERARLNLARQMGIAYENSSKLQDNLLNINTDTVQIPIVNAAVIDLKPEILEAQQQLKINELQLQRENKLYLPSLSLYGNLSAQHLSNNLAVWDKWFPFAYLGAQVSVPLYDGGLKNRNKEGFQLQTQINQNNLSRLREELTYELQSATIDLKNAISQLQDAAQNLQNARAIQNIDQTRYQEGALLFADFRNTEFSLRESETNFLAASQNYLLAQLRWLNANGTL
ncbi:MAG: TolC family protein [Saprospiraceae bacterium]|nr:TolC family protein [Saprospiraceae bacterium]